LIVWINRRSRIHNNNNNGIVFSLVKRKDQIKLNKIIILRD